MLRLNAAGAYWFAGSLLCIIAAAKRSCWNAVVSVRRDVVPALYGIVGEMHGLHAPMHATRPRQDLGPLCMRQVI